MLACPQADDEEAAALELKKKRTFRKFSYRGIDLDNLLDLTPEQLIDLVHARARRRLSRGIKRKGMALLKKVRAPKPVAARMHPPMGAALTACILPWVLRHRVCLRLAARSSRRACAREHDERRLPHL